ncbi:MAG: hypothetical protein ACQEUM_02610 [Pseudomonadota bacterium]
MTQTQDTAAITKANEILAEADTASLEALQAALAGVTAEMREAHNSDPAGVSGATSLEERRKLEEQDRERVARLEITTALWRRLNDAVRAAEARDAIANADDDRASLAASLDALEEAQRVAAQAKAKAMASLDTLKKAKQAAGTRGRGLVGADPHQIDKALALQAVRPTDIAPEGHVKHTSANGLRRVAQREDAQRKAS